MRAAYRYILLPITLLLASLSGFSQPGQLRFTQVNVNDGLSHNQVNCILKDSRNFLWFGTLSGLSRYDGYGFKVFRHDMKDSASLSDNYITGIFELPGDKLWIITRNGEDIYDAATETFDRNTAAYLQKLSLPNGVVDAVVKDKAGNYWFLYDQAGLYRYRPNASPPVHIQYRSGDAAGLSNNDVAAIAADNADNIWILQGDGMLEKLDAKTGKVTYRNDTLRKMNNASSQPYRIFIDRDNDLWMYISGDAAGVYYFNPANGAFLHLTKDAGPHRLNNDIVYAITQDSKGTIWVGTDHGGINLISKKDFSVRYLMHNPEDPKSLAQNSVYALYRDGAGIIWVGTYKKGVCYYNEIFNRFPLYSHEPDNTHSLPYEDVNRFVEDEKGNLWIGTNGGGLIYFDRQNNAFRQYVHDPGNPNSLCNNVIVGLCMDRDHKLWIGTYYGGLDCYDGKTFTHYRHDPRDSASLSNDKVWDVFEDKGGNIWAGTLGGGLNRFDRKRKKFIRYPGTDPGLAALSYVLVITPDQSGRLWLGTAGGIEVLDPQTGRFTRYAHDPVNPHSLSNDNINAILQDSRGWVWIGTREGLNCFDPDTKRFRTFTTKDGLPDNTILTILEDREHRLWMSTPNGLSCLTIHTAGNGTGDSFLFRNYDESDGLQGREFNEKSAYETREGELLFGGANGFNMFNPARITISKQVAPVVFTDLQIFNQSVKIGEKIRKSVILPEAIGEMRSITLPYGANDFSIGFAALGYMHSRKNKYAFKLDGFNENWIITDGALHKATYTNLDPGKYIFRVKASNNDGVWGRKETLLEINILPPFWKTAWAYLLYTLLILGALYLARSILLYRARMNFRMEQQQHEAQRRHQLDMMKIRFFTNISHEFRTPLTLILTPIERLLKQPDGTDHRNQLQLIQRNAKRLLHLVNQLLDFRKMEVQEIKLNPSRGDIIKFISEIAGSFTDIADKKNIHFTLETSIESLEASFDSDKLERILFNLLSNAFKFTPEAGAISVHLDLHYTGTPEDNGAASLQISVEDNGIGIPPEKQERIFERFFQHDMPGTVVNPGSGIGLAITREFVRLHHGTVRVDSEPGKGSCFTVLLPVTPVDALPHVSPAAPSTITLLPFRKEETGTGPAQRNGRKPTVLLIDDNEDFRFYLKDNLGVHFNITEAANGKEGWEKALSAKPELIVSDIMMPEMNGIELSKKLKKDPRTALIPLILLTARAEEEQQLEGFETGANDYITKPFNFEILLARIHNLLAEKKQRHKAEPPKVDISPAEAQVVSVDDKLIKEAIAIVEENISNPDFSVEQLSHSLYVSRVTLYKKMIALTGKTPIEFIRTIRLKRAARLLEKAKITVAEAAYEVGFNNPKYFTKYFKEEFGMLPSEYARENKDKPLP